MFETTSNKTLHFLQIYTSVLMPQKVELVSGKRKKKEKEKEIKQQQQQQEKP